MAPEFTAPAARSVARFLTAAVCCLLLLSTLGQLAKYYWGHPQVLGLVPAFYVDYESNVPTWYSSCALLLAASLMAVIAVLKTTAKDPHRWQWAALALIFVALSADEVAGFHELPIDAMRDRFDMRGVLYYPWVILGAVFLLLVAAAMWRMLWALPKATRNSLFLAAAVFVGGALGVEMLSGLQASRHGEENFTYAMIITLEEACEMFGVVILIHALIDYIHREFGAVRFTIGRHAAG